MSCILTKTSLGDVYPFRRSESRDTILVRQHRFGSNRFVRQNIRDCLYGWVWIRIHDLKTTTCGNTEDHETVLRFVELVF